MTEIRFWGIGAGDCRNRNLLIRQNAIHSGLIGIRLHNNNPVNNSRVELNQIELDPTLVQSYAGIVTTEMPFPPHNESVIEENTTTDDGAWYGILAAGTNYIKVEDNKVYPGTENNFDGISMQFTPNAMVRDNKVSGPGTGGSGIVNRGIRVVESQSTWALCNEMKNLRQGLFFEGNSPASTVARNEFISNLNEALYYEEGARTGHQNNMQNLWCENTSLEFEALHLGGQFDQNIYRVHPNDGECVRPDPVDPEFGWFFDNSSISPVQACALFERDQRNMPDSFDLLIATDQITEPGHAPAYLWNVRSGLYRHLKHWPAKEWENTVYEDFLAEMDTSDVGIWYAIEEDIYQHLLPDSAYLEFLAGYQDTLAGAWTAIAQFRTDLAEATNPTDSLQAIASIDSVLLALDGFADYWDAVMHRQDSLYKAGLWDLGVQVNSISAPDDWTWSFKTVWRAYLRWVWQDVDTLSNAMIEDLETIAAACATTHGFAVHLALGLLLHVEGYNYHHPDCFTAEKPLSNREVSVLEAPEMTLIPNPAQDQVLVRLDHTLAGGEILIYHISGSLVHRQIVVDEMTMMQIGHLPTGMYVVQWISDRGERISRSLAIQR